MYRTPKVCYRKAPVRHETEREECYRLGDQEMWGVKYHILGKMGKIEGYGKPKYIKEVSNV